MRETNAYLYTKFLFTPLILQLSRNIKLCEGWDLNPRTPTGQDFLSDPSRFDLKSCAVGHAWLPSHFECKREIEGELEELCSDGPSQE